MLEGNNIILRPLKMSDWEKTYNWRNDPEIKQQAMMHSFPVTEMVEREWYENMLKSTNDKTVYFTITLKNDEPIGFVTLNKINYIHKNCALGIVIGEKGNQGKGYGKETMKLIIDYAFNTLNLTKITLEVLESNKAAYTLYKNMGFVEEGRLKWQFYSMGKFIDVLILSLFKD